MSKFIYVLCLLVVSISIMHAQQCEHDHSFDRLLKQADRYRVGIVVERNYEKAFDLYQQCSNDKSPKAMNCLANMYKDGLGCKKNIKKAIKLYRKAGKLGYSKAWYNLGLLYKNGLTGDVDYATAYECFVKCAELGASGGMYGAGYMLYTGHGVQQNYEKAVKYFKQGAALESPSCLFFLGVCYRNGYGVEKNENKAKMLLMQSAHKGYNFANDELKLQLAENQVNAKKTLKLSNNSSLSPGALIENIQLHGIWQGVKHTYDFSEQYVLNKDSVVLSISEYGDFVITSLNNVNNETVNIQGELDDSALYFSRDSIKLSNRYGGNHNWQLRKEKVSLTQIEDTVYLHCRVREFSPDTKELSKPYDLTFWKICKSTNASSLKSQKVVQSSDLQDAKNLLALKQSSVNNIYPNPFSQNCTIEYQVFTDCAVKLMIYDMSGRQIEMQDMGQQQAGKYRRQLGGNLISGTYFISLMLDNTQQKFTVIKVDK